MYDAKQKEFLVGGPPSFPIANADSVGGSDSWTAMPSTTES